MGRIIFIIVIIFLIFHRPSVGQDSIIKPPNLVFILADDLGYGDLECYGHAIVKTPNLNQLAEQGIKFMQYYAPSPLCSPSRAGILTGRTPYRTGIRSWIPSGEAIHLGNNEVTIAQLLKKKGYHTAIMGKFHLNGGANMSDQPQPGDMGFDYSFVVHEGWVQNEHVESNTSDGKLRYGKMHPDNYYRNGTAVGATEKFSAALVADEAIHWLENRNNVDPFFLYLPFTEVHTPVASPEEYVQMYADNISAHAKANPDLCYRDWINAPYRGTGEYYANISFLDAQIGRIMNRLKEMDIWDNTIIIFTSDNGPVTRETRKSWELNMAGETGGLRGRKDNLLEGGIRVPAIVCYSPIIRKGLISHTPVYGLDWLPTLSEIMDYEIPTDRKLDGMSIANIMGGAEMKRRQPMIWTIDMPNEDDPVNEWALRDGDWKLLMDRDEKPKFLFNLANDPYEVVNLVAENEVLLDSLVEKFNLFKSDIENDAIKLARTN